MIEELLLADFDEAEGFSAGHLDVDALISAIEFCCASDHLLQFLRDRRTFAQGVYYFAEGAQSLLLPLRPSLLQVLPSRKTQEPFLVHLQHFRDSNL